MYCRRNYRLGRLASPRKTLALRPFAAGDVRYVSRADVSLSQFKPTV